MLDPSTIHCTAAKRLLRYLKGTKDLSLILRPHTSSNLHCLLFLGQNPISWSSKKQLPVALFSLQLNIVPLPLLPPKFSSKLSNMSLNMSRSDEVHRATREEIDKKCFGEPVEINSPRNKQKRKRYHRHTPQQIQAMEEFFKDCPHPDNKQRIELSQDLEMDPLQVKFWFQNKRTQMKMKHERQQNTNLRAENEKLLAENTRFRDALSNASCPACGRMANIGDVSLDERYLRMENARLRDEINRISGVAANYVGKPITKSTDTPASRVLHSVNLGTGPVFRGSPNKGKGVDDSHDKPKNNTP